MTEHGALTCPKCHGSMRSYERQGVNIEQCQTCRGIFLDFGELEHLVQAENRLVQGQALSGHGQGQNWQQPPAAPYAPTQGYPQQYAQPGYGPEWGHRDNHRYRRKGIGSLFFSS